MKLMFILLTLTNWSGSDAMKHSFWLETYCKEPVTALAIIKLESNFKSNAIHTNTNKSYDSGLMQVNSIHGYNKKMLLSSEFNILVGCSILNKHSDPGLFYSKTQSLRRSYAQKILNIKRGMIYGQVR